MKVKMKVLTDNSVTSELLSMIELCLTDRLTQLGIEPKEKDEFFFRYNDRFKICIDDVVKSFTPTESRYTVQALIYERF